MKKLNRIGEKFITNEGYEVEIIEYFSNKNITIKFENNFIFHNIQLRNLIRGQVSNPYHTSKYNMGYLGIGKYKAHTDKKATLTYKIWTSMLRRCYDEKFKQINPTYTGVTVYEKWHDFQNFGAWFEKSYIDGFELDKDILIKGNKIYSPETCCFVPHEINSLFVKKDNKRGIYSIGVCKHRNKYMAQITMHSKHYYLGIFDTPEEAFQIYKEAKEQHIKEVADKWKGLISDKVYEALINYQVEIDD